MSLQDNIEKRDQFLKTHPNLQEYQDEIDEILNKCSNPKDRMIAILMMLNGKLDDLKNIIEKMKNEKR